MKKCLICLKSITEDLSYHKSCAKDLFGAETEDVPTLNYGLDDISELAKKSVKQSVTVPGVQSKLSMEIQKSADASEKLTIVGLWGSHILKPPSEHWNELPANEHATMTMAEKLGIEVVPNGLLTLASGEWCYVTKRIDRGETRKKIAMEDMCQLTERLTEDKYKGSHEQIAKKIKQYSENPLFDILRYFELVLFSYLTGNADMHLKNFSLLKSPDLGWKLAPAYDLLSTRLVIPETVDSEELALTLQDKNSKFSLTTFKEFGKQIGLNSKQIQNTFEKLASSKHEMVEILGNSFLSSEMKTKYLEVLSQRFQIF